MSPELETLDQLLGGEMPLAVIRAIDPDDARFAQGMTGLLAGGDVRLCEGGLDVPPRRWRAVLAGDRAGFSACLTDAGASRVG